MLPKLSVEQFYEIKNRLIAEFETVQKRAESIDFKDVSEEEQIRITKEILENYTAIQNELLSYDLSDIPFEAWENIILFGYDVLDLSQTHANIDFKLLEQCATENGINLKGCKVRNLQYVGGPILERFLDQETTTEFPELFLSDSFTPEFKEKFARNQLLIEDFYSLNAEQIAELESKKITSHISRDYDWSWSIIETIDNLGLYKVTEIYFQDKNLIYDLNYIYNDLRYDIKKEDITIHIKQLSTIEEIKSYVHNLIIKYISENETRTIEPKKFSDELKSNHPKYFPTNPNIPKETLERFYRRRLTIEDLINYGELFGDLNLLNFSSIPYPLDDIIKPLGINFQRIIKEMPNLYDLIEELRRVDYSFEYDLRNLLSQSDLSDPSISTADLKDRFIQSILKASYRNAYEFAHTDNPQIYENTLYPDWIKELGYYATKANDYRDFHFIDFLTPETEITVENLKNIFNVLGLENIRRFNKKHYYFNDNVLKCLCEITLTDLTPVTSYEEFESRLVEIIRSYKPMNSYSTNYLTQNLSTIGGEFREKFGGLFVPEDAPEQLRKVFYDGNLTLASIMKYPEWISYVKHLSPEVLGLNIPIQIINSSIGFPQAPQPYTLSQLYLEHGTIEELLIFISSYSLVDSFVEKCIKDKVIDINGNNREDIEKNIRKAIRKAILTESFRFSYSEHLPENFKQENPDLFLPADAPKDLKWSFYNKYLNISTLINQPEYLQYLKGINLDLISDIPKTIGVKNPQLNVTKISFQELYVNKFGSETFLKFIIQYYPASKNLSNFNISIIEGTQAEIEEALENVIANIIANNNSMFNENFPEHFKETHPDLFISHEAPQELKDFFYQRKLGLDELKAHPEWIEYLEEVNLNLIQNVPKEIGVAVHDPRYKPFVQRMKFQELYINQYGQKSFLKFLAKYGSITSLFSKVSILVKDTSKEELETALELAVANIIKHKNSAYSEDFPIDFKEKFSDIFLPENAPAELKQKFYGRQLTIDFLAKNPEFYQYLRNIDLESALSGSRFEVMADDRYTNVNQSIPKILTKISQDKLLDLITLYGTYLSSSILNINVFEGPDFETIKKQVEAGIIEAVKEGRIPHDEDAPSFIKEQLPTYFLDTNAPEELKKFFYRINVYNDFTFAEIKSHEKEWIPFLKGKDLTAPINRLNNYSTKTSYLKYIELFGNELALKLGLQRTEVVDKMLSANQAEVMYNWYLKTGKKFLPDTVIMQNFSLDEADKFLSHGKEWSSLMKNKRFATHIEGREAMLKLAYCFGVFDGDNQGIKKLDSLLNDLPRKLNENDFYKLVEMERTINDETSRIAKYGEVPYKQLEETMSIEGLSVEEFSIIRTFYRDNGDGTFTLKVNLQNYPKTRELLRQYMEENNVSTIVSPNKAHTMFGSFKMIYNNKFREFLLNNLEVFQTNPEYNKYLSAIHEQFDEIQVANSNRVLTVELAISFVQQNKYAHINVGNDELSRVSGIAGYSQTDFNKLQEIFEHGKTRVVSSIPRVTGEYGNYYYEILRLTDPLAVAIGTLTDCCQELNNAAEVCMEHSMVSSHGRVFVIKDKEGNIISQSWVWRSGNVLCFDNIEIPDKAFTRAQRVLGQNSAAFAENVYNIYKQAAKELIEQDEKVYKELLDSGKITREQYEGLRLGKVTVGLGYNDIAEALTKNAPKDKGNIARPLAFTPPVELSRGLYTSDSTEQYILEEREGRKDYSGDTITAHYDELEAFDMKTITERQLLSLRRFEVQYGRDYYMLNSEVEDMSQDKIMEQLASNYGTHPESTKVVITPTFAMVYDDSADINIVDIFLNKDLSSTQREKAMLQLKLALIQLQKTGKALIVSRLEPRQINIINESLDIKEEQLDTERGISRGTN